MDSLWLQYWIYGDDFEEILLVKIPRTETVGDLKKAIKNKHSATFSHIDMRMLDLYAIAMPEDERIEATLQEWTLEGKRRLKPRSKLLELIQSDTLIIVHAPNLDLHVAKHVAVPDMTLNCWIRGQDTSQIFIVKISITETVMELKKAIKTENSVACRDIDASDLILYRVCFPWNDNFESLLGAHSISSLGKPLWGLQKLSAVFTSLLPDQLHLIVDGLALSFQCWVRGADPAHSLEVRIPVRATVGGLKNSIKTTYGKTFDNISPDRMKLYKIATDNTVELCKVLRSPESGRFLKRNEYLNVFDDVPFSQVPRVVVELLRKAVPSAEHPQLHYIQAWHKGSKISPSEQGEASKFKDLQLTDCRIGWARPPSCASIIPVTLLHPVFGQFVDDCHVHEPTSEDNAFVFELSSEMSKFFDDERQRQKVFIDILRSHDIGMVPSSFGGYHTDGHMHVNGRRYAILETKSEVGSKGAEPYCQAVLSYIGASEGEVAKVLEMDVWFNFPCFIVTLFGPHLSFSGAVWASCPNYQILTTALPLFWHRTDTIMRRSAARHVGAFKKACRSLRELYEKFDQAPGDFKDLQPEFPHPRCYTSLDGKEQVGFKYVCILEATKLLFVVETDIGEQLCVKFARTYGREVHEQCAAWGISPLLRGFDVVPGGWHMVVMDFLGDDYECLPAISRSRDFSHEQKERLRDELRRKLTDLHQLNLVHGDVRDANVMVSKDRSRWKLVDFDWSGKMNEVRYPMNVNRGPGVQRPKGAVDGELILADHDMEMLGYFF